MRNRNRLTYAFGALLAATVVLVATGGCSAVAAVQGAAEGCSGLDLTSQAQASVKGWVDTVNALNMAAG